MGISTLRGKERIKAGAYYRVSTDKQDLENQRSEVRNYCKGNEYELVQEYQDIESGGISGRSGLNDMIMDGRAGKFKFVIVVELSRFSRGGISKTFKILDTLKAYEIGWLSIREPWASTNNPINDVILSVISWASEQERKLISERTKSAMARRKALGVHCGRPKGKKDKKPRTRRTIKEIAKIKGGYPFSYDDTK